AGDRLRERGLLLGVEGVGPAGREEAGHLSVERSPPMRVGGKGRGGGEAMIEARYVHTNIVARDWRRLAAFYEAVFGWTPVRPGRDLSGPAFDRATGIAGVHIRGVHLRLPGTGPDGPTLEVFEYDPPAPESEKAIHRPGLAHLAFAVGDVDAAVEAVLAAGGGAYGSAVSVPVA